ncbi:MAG: hypothetical protein EOP41_04305, partial [Sphingobacteriaceae bacterium]
MRLKFLSNTVFMPIKTVSGLFFLFLLMTDSSTFAQKNTLPDWAFGGFKRPAGLNPIISPDSTTKFLDPILNKQV